MSQRHFSEITMVTFNMIQFSLYLLMAFFFAYTLLYFMGINIDQVQLKNINPPQPVQTAVLRSYWRSTSI